MAALDQHPPESTPPPLPAAPAAQRKGNRFRSACAFCGAAVGFFGALRELMDHQQGKSEGPTEALLVFAGLTLFSLLTLRRYSRHPRRRAALASGLGLFAAVVAAESWRGWKGPDDFPWERVVRTPAGSAPAVPASSESGQPTPAADPGPSGVRVISDLGLTLQPVPAGQITLGSAKGEADERPTTEVVFSRPFWLGSTEVTQSQWEAVMGDNPSRIVRPDHPVSNVPWARALEFCQRLTERERAAGRLPAGHEYTLPTEAQWEYACRAGSRDDVPIPLETAAWYLLNADLIPHPVGQKAPNGWGLYDMLGNVLEWCWDWHGPYPGGRVTDPVGPATGFRRVIRGAGFSDPPEACRPSAREGWEPRTSRMEGRFAGLRVALVPQP